MSTTIATVETEELAAVPDLLCLMEADSLLFHPRQLKKRLMALDALDAAFGSSLGEAFTHSLLHRRAETLVRRLEAANAALYQSVRSGIVRNTQPHALLQWLDDLARDGESSASPGLGFDYRDEFISGVLQLPEPGEPDLQLSPEMVHYQPTPVRHILRLIETAMISRHDVFVDLGSGLGHVPILVSMIAGAQSVGVEMQPAYVASAQECAQSLQLSRVQFVAQDARAADLSHGTVFYLYSPFKGSILADVLDALRKESSHRPIKICSLGPCTHRVSKETWLRTSGLADADFISIFHSL